MNFNIFYSWQSSIGGNANRGYIRDKIKSALSTLEVQYTILEDSRGTTGAPDIPNEILTQIAQSDLFVCDVTPVYIYIIDDNTKKGIPNPNVMFELGFAVRCLGWERIICICNEEFGHIDCLPFDISKHRILGYKKKEDDRKSLRSLSLIKPLEDIVNNYESILLHGNELDYKKHDVEIFNNLMGFVTEREFINSINDFKSTGRFFKWYEKGWDYIQYFQEYPENKFVSPVLNESFKELSIALDNLKSLTCRICHAYNTQYWEYEEPDIEYTKEQIQEILMTQEYRKRDIPYPSNCDDNNLRKYYDAIEKDEKDIVKHSNDILTAYSIFRDAVKRELII